MFRVVRSVLTALENAHVKLDLSNQYLVSCSFHKKRKQIISLLRVIIFLFYITVSLVAEHLQL